jgi:hypothetical protein
MMEGKEFLTVAQKLAQARTEASIRSAYSRAYYGIFNMGLKLLSDLGFILPKDAFSHELLYHRLNNCGISDINLLQVKSLQKKQRLFPTDRKTQLIKPNPLGSSISWRLSFWLRLVRVGDLANRLKALRLKRVSADYDMKNRDFQAHTECEFAIARAKLTIAQLEGCYQQPLRNRLKDGIHEYERKIGLH